MVSLAILCVIMISLLVKGIENFFSVDQANTNEVVEAFETDV